MARSRQAMFPAIQIPRPGHAATQTVFVSATFIVATLIGTTSRGPVLTKNGALQNQLVPEIRVRDPVSIHRLLTDASFRGAPGYVVRSLFDYLDSVTFCADGNICCGFTNIECCNAGQGHAKIVCGQTAVTPSSTGAVLSSYYSGVHVYTIPITRTSTAPSNQTSGSQNDPSQLELELFNESNELRRLNDLRVPILEFLHGTLSSGRLSIARCQNRCWCRGCIWSFTPDCYHPGLHLSLHPKEASQHSIWK